MTNSEAISQFFKSTITDLKADQVSKGLYSSGKSAESLQADSNTEGGLLYGSAYFYQQIVGRKPGRMPPVSDIIAWIEAKGIQPENGTVEGLAWAIAKKIAKEGTDIHEGKSQGLDFIKIVGKNRDELIKNFISGTKEQIITSLRSAIKQKP